jgi:hypothetical protein
LKAKETETKMRKGKKKSDKALVGKRNLKPVQASNCLLRLNRKIVIKQGRKCKSKDNDGGIFHPGIST